MSQQQFASIEEECEYLRSRLKEKEADFDDLHQTFEEFQASSREFEQELEKELSVAEKKCSDLGSMTTKLQQENEDLKAKIKNINKQNATKVQNLEDEINSLKNGQQMMKGRITELELQNDDLERKCRANEASAKIASEQHERSLERQVYVEGELEEYKMSTTEIIQRLKDEIRDLNSELTALQSLTKKTAITQNHHQKPEESQQYHTAKTTRQPLHTIWKTLPWIAVPVLTIISAFYIKRMRK